MDDRAKNLRCELSNQLAKIRAELAGSMAFCNTNGLPFGVSIEHALSDLRVIETWVLSDLYGLKEAVSGEPLVPCDSILRARFEKMAQEIKKGEQDRYG